MKKPREKYAPGTNSVLDSMLEKEMKHFNTCYVRKPFSSSRMMGRTTFGTLLQIHVHTLPPVLRVQSEEEQGRTHEA